jgi:hypothetical protein
MALKNAQRMRDLRPANMVSELSHTALCPPQKNAGNTLFNTPSWYTCSFKFATELQIFWGACLSRLTNLAMIRFSGQFFPALLHPSNRG